MKHRYILLLFCLVIFGCGSENYIAQVPFKYDYSVDLLKKQNKMSESALENQAVVVDNTENLSDEILALKEKYAIVLGVVPAKITDYKMYSYVDKWIDTPYKEKSFSKQGIDCAYFIQSLCSSVYKVTLPKDPAGMFRSKSIQLFTGRDFLEEGDLVFFRYSKDNPISDVGMYLHNDRIVACTEKGLAIYNFNDEYFQLRYIASGRIIKEEKLKVDEAK
jgi:lipoprotein Spr